MDFKPSQIDVFHRSFLPFIGTFDHSEVESAAGILVSAMAHHGDEWKFIGPKDIGEWSQVELKNGEHWSKLFKNPFLQPDFHKLVAEGWAEWEDGAFGPGAPLKFTQKALDRMKEKGWVTRQPKDVQPLVEAAAEAHDKLGDEELDP